MGTMLADLAAERHLEKLDVHPEPAKAHLKNLERPWREEIGRAIQRCFSLAGLTQDQAAREMNRDPGQIGRWVSGAERPLLDAMFAVKRLRGPLIIALAELGGGHVEVRTQIILRRIA